MKKLFLSLITAIACGAGAMAQDSRVATLQHGTNIKAYYGPDALAEAHKGAVDGDIITLSAGEFNACNTTKAITIRGEGRDKSVISGSSNMTLTIPQGSTYPLSLEGLTIRINKSNALSIKGTDGTETAIISKCYFYIDDGTSFYQCNAVVVQSYLNAYYDNCGITAADKSNVTCINSILKDMAYSGTGKFDVQNCVIIQSPNVMYSSFKNSIICTVCSLDSSNTSKKCLVKEGSSGFDDSWYITVTAPDPGPWSEPSDVVVWDDLFTGNYHLTDEASATYVGTDGKEVGIYGGAYPYEMTPDYPLVKDLDVMGSYNDGKLKVQLNVE